TPLTFFSIILRPPGSTLFPYTTLFRSWLLQYAEGQEVPPEILEMLNQQVTAAAIVLKLIWNLFAYVIFGMLGGVLGVALFRRKRSEEHTSELQSRENLVCRLLLEKKNN